MIERDEVLTLKTSLKVQRDVMVLIYLKLMLPSVHDLPLSLKLFKKRHILNLINYDSTSIA